MSFSSFKKRVKRRLLEEKEKIKRRQKAGKEKVQSR